MLDLFKKLFLVVYATTKVFLQPRLNNSNNKKIKVITKAIITLITILGICMSIILIFPFALFRMFLICYLKLNYGRMFGGLLKGYDSTFEEDVNGTAGRRILLLSCSDESPVAFERLKTRIEIMYKSCSKLSSCIKSIFGYYYYVTDKVKFYECVEYVNDECVTINELLKYTEQNYFCIKQEHTWRVFFVRIASNMHEVKNTQIALIFLFRHSLGDGYFMEGLVNAYLYDCTEKIRLNISETMPNLNMNYANLPVNPFTLKDDGKKLRIEGHVNSHVAVLMEDEGDCLSKIKKVKKDLGVSFGAILMTITWAATCGYFKKRQIKFSNLVVVQTLRDTMATFFDTMNGTLDFNKISNEFGVLGLSIPFKPEEQSIKSTVLYVNHYLEILHQSTNCFMSYVLTHLLAYNLPAKLIILMYITFLPTITVAVSNMAAASKKSIAGYKVDHQFAFITEAAHSVFKFFINTYDNKIYLVLSSNRGYVNNSEELQNILTDVFRSIDALEEEVTAEKALKSNVEN